MKAILRVLGVVLLLSASACSQPASTTSEPSAAAPNVEDQARIVLDALTPVISNEIGQPVALQPMTANVVDDWAYIAARPTSADGAALEWATTNLASRYENGVMDESGAVHALLHKENGAWVLVEHVIAPTDVAWVDWAARHNVPAGVIDAPAAP